MKIRLSQSYLQRRAQQYQQEGKELLSALFRAVMNPAELPPAVEHIVQAAVRKAHIGWKRARATFSQFAVGAAIIDERGRIWYGGNVESSSYGLSLCAERNALTTALAYGASAIIAVVVYVPNQFVPPCGACRQLLYDYAPESVVILSDGMQRQFVPLEKLLPLAFDRNLLRQH